MKIPIEPELVSICREITNKGLGVSQWSEIESDDMFQLGNFVGGFDADEGEFCFSYFASNKVEYWFQLNLHVVKQISQGINPTLIGRSAE